MYRWPNGVVPYTIDPAIANPGRITAAIGHWNTSLAGHLRLVPRTNETYYLAFKLAAPSTCSSYVGFIRMAAQPVNIGDYCSTGNVVHEIGHAIGLYHEQSRSDRDRYVQILTQNIQSGMAGNFARMTDSLNPGAYDYASIMHYPAGAFSANGQPTIVTIPAGIPIGQRTTLSTLDVSGVKAMYPSSGTTAPPTTNPPTTTNPPPPPPPTSNVALTVGSSPAGRTLMVGNASYSTTTTLQLPLNSTHTVSAPNATVGSTRYTFQRWSDNGAQTHPVTLRSALSLTATYSLSYQFMASATAGGRLYQSLAYGDNFYPAGTQVTLQAIPDANSCFTGWTGLIDIPDTAILVTLNGPATVKANFANGSITLPSYVTSPKAGAVISANVTATSGCYWRAQSLTSWITVEGSATGRGSAALRLKVAANPLPYRRGGYVLAGNRYLTVIQD